MAALALEKLHKCGKLFIDASNNEEINEKWKEWNQQKWLRRPTTNGATRRRCRRWRWKTLNGRSVECTMTAIEATGDERGQKKKIKKNEMREKKKSTRSSDLLQQYRRNYVNDSNCAQLCERHQTTISCLSLLFALVDIFITGARQWQPNERRRNQNNIKTKDEICLSHVLLYVQCLHANPWILSTLILSALIVHRLAWDQSDSVDSVIITFVDKKQFIFCVLLCSLNRISFH